MSERAEVLGTLFEKSVGELAALLEGATDADWQTRCPDEERPVGVVAHHVAGGLHAQVGWLLAVANGQPLPPITAAMIDEQNETHAARHAHHSKVETLAALQRNADMAAAAIRALSDEQLDRAGWMPLFGERPLTAEQIVRGVMIRHIIQHTRSMRAALAH